MTADAPAKGTVPHSVTIQQGEPIRVDPTQDVLDNSRFTEDAGGEDNGEGVVQAGGDRRTQKDETKDNLKARFKVTAKADTANCSSAGEGPRCPAVCKDNEEDALKRRR